MRRKLPLVAAALCLALAGLSSARAESVGGPAAGYELAWHTIAAGGASLNTGSSYQLGGAIGQPDAGTLGGDGYTLGGGFWPGGVAADPVPYRIYLPGLLRND